MNILVAGSTGNTGTRLLKELCERGHDIIALFRASSDTGGLPDTVTLRQGDPADRHRTSQQCPPLRHAEFGRSRRSGPR